LVDRIFPRTGLGVLGRLDHERDRGVTEDEVAVALAPVHVAGGQLRDHDERALRLTELDRLRGELRAPVAAEQPSERSKP